MRSEHETGGRRGRGPGAHAAGRGAAPVRGGRVTARARVVREKEVARAGVRPRTGLSTSERGLTEDMIHRMPVPLRWAIDALLVLTMTGVVPALLCWGLVALCEAVGWWPVAALLALEFAYVLGAV